MIVADLCLCVPVVFFWVAISCLTMQLMIVLEPLLQTKNPLHYNVYQWAFKYMNYSKSSSPRNNWRK